MGKKDPPGVPSKITFIFLKDSFPSLLFVGFFPKLLGSFVGNGGAWDPQPLGFRHWDTKFRSLWGANQRRPTSKVLTWGQTLWDLSPRVDGQCEICGFDRHSLCGCEDGWHHSRLGRSQVGWEFLHSSRGAGTKLGS